MQTRETQRVPGAGWLFARTFLRHPRRTGALLPSSRFLVDRMLRLVDWERAAVVVEFGPGLNVLTGETGAGKSIILDAMSLLLGGRADLEDVRSGTKTAIVEGIVVLM